MAGQLQSGRVVHIDQALSNVAINYRPQGFIADMVFPMVSVQKQSGLYIIHDQGDLFRREDARRSRGTEAKKLTFRTSSDKYYCDNYALKADVTLEDRINADPIFVTQFEQGRVRNIQDKLALDKELRVSSLAFNTAQVGSSAAVGSAWTDYLNSRPLLDIWTAIDNVHYATGYRPTDILFGSQAFDNFRRNVQVADRANNGNGGPNVTGGGPPPGVQAIANMLELQVHVGNAFSNTAEEGQANTLNPIWGDHALVYYRPSNPSITDPSFGYTFRWAAPGLPNMQVERHPYDSRRKIDELEIGYYQDEKVTGSALSFLVTNVTSSTT